MTSKPSTSFFRHSSWVLGITALALVASSARASIKVDNLHVENAIVSFGEAAPPYFGQTFRAEGHFLREVTFLLASASGPGDTHFRLLITEVSPISSGGVHPTNVLFESSELSVPFDSTYPINSLDFTEFIVDVGSIPLDVGETYAFMLDAFVAYDGVDGSAGSGRNDDYAEGHFFSYAGHVPSIGGDRSDHFADTDNWRSRTASAGFPEDDLTFVLKFTSREIPEASGLVVWSWLVGIVLGVRRRG